VKSGFFGKAMAAFFILSGLGASAYLFEQVSERGNYFEMVLLHTNDFHSRIYPLDESGVTCRGERAHDECIGGVARLAAKINEIRGEERNVLLVDAGDQFQGSLFFTSFKEKPLAFFMNLLGYDAMVLGNHEFDDGTETLGRFIDAVDFPILAANVDASRDPYLRDKVLPWVILNLGSEQIGITGYLTEDTPMISQVGPYVEFLSIRESVAKAVEELQNRGINKIIALSHSGVDRDIIVAAQVEGIDVIVSGHTHTLLSNTHPNTQGPYPIVRKTAEKDAVLIVSAGEWGKFLGRIKLVFDQEGALVGWSGDTIPMDKHVEPDPEVLRELLVWGEEIEELYQLEVGVAATPLDGEGASCRFRECTLGNVITDALLEYTQTHSQLQGQVQGERRVAQIALQNAGGIRSSLPEGAVTMAQIQEAFPFDNHVVSFDLTGADIKDVLEYGVSVADRPQARGTGRFLQVSGLRYTWDFSQEVGSRVQKIDVVKGKEFEPLDESKVYRVVSNDFLLQGGDGFEVLAQKATEPHVYDVKLDEVLTLYFQKASLIRGDIEGRIQKSN
jgi:5'-nucleotidase / UDP-sugar diphosphatase